jgi:hypothetical protein
MIDIDKIIKERCKGFNTLSYDHCMIITSTARALSLEEVYDHMLITPESLSAEESAYAEMLYRRGKTIGVKDACDKLFAQMGMRGGGQVAMEYLSKQSGQFQAVVVANPKGTFGFSITIPEPK